MEAPPVTLTSGLTVKLGRLKPVARTPTPRLSCYLDLAGATPPPDVVDYTPKAKAALARMYLNDTYGDCVIAGVGHGLGVASGNDTGTPILCTDAEILAVYRIFSPRGDHGCVISQVLDRYQDTGFQLGGALRKIDGYVSVDNTNKLETQIAIFLFSSLKLGINLPHEWVSSQVWDVTNSMIVGGHDVELISYNATGPIVSTWGSTRQMTWAALASHRIVDECFLPLYPEWYGLDNLAPVGLDKATLAADLAKIGTGDLPPIAPEQPPMPVVPPDPNGPKQPPSKSDVQAAIDAAIEPLWP